MLQKLTTCLIILFVTLEIVATGSSRRCSECEEEIWEEVPCDQIPTTSTPKLNKPAIRSQSLRTTTPRPIVPTTILPVLTTATQVPLALTTVQPVSTTAYVSPKRRCYCDCKAGCREFCRQLSNNADPQKEITQLSKTTQLVNSGQIETKHLYERKFIPSTKNYGSLYYPDTQKYEQQLPLPMPMPIVESPVEPVDVLSKQWHPSNNLNNALPELTNSYLPTLQVDKLQPLQGNIVASLPAVPACPCKKSKPQNSKRYKTLNNKYAPKFSDELLLTTPNPISNLPQTAGLKNAAYKNQYPYLTPPSYPLTTSLDSSTDSEINIDNYLKNYNFGNSQLLNNVPYPPSYSLSY